MDVNWYDYGARFYDPRIGRWLTIDPSSEKYYTFSQYIYAGDNPLIYIDPNGEDLIKVIVPSNVNGSKTQSILVDSKAAEKFYNFAWEANKRFGLVVGSSFRSKQYQKNLRDRWDKGDRKGLWVRPATVSSHSAGFAIDLNVSHLGLTNSNKDSEHGLEMLQQLSQFAENSGFKYFGSNDIGHFYLEPSDYGYKDTKEATDVNDDFYNKNGDDIMTYSNKNKKEDRKKKEDEENKSNSSWSWLSGLSEGTYKMINGSLVKQ